LAFVIGMLGYILISAAKMYLEKNKKEPGNSHIPKTAMLIAFSFCSLSLMAQDSSAVVQTVTTTSLQVKGLSTLSLYTLLSVIGLELIIILALAYNLKLLLAKEKIRSIAADTVYKPVFDWKKMWAKMNNFKPVHEEINLELDHDYDGIRELDNRLPPWWLYGFYLTILFSAIYLWRFEVSHSAPNGIEEYQLAMQKAEVEKAAYLEKAASQVDENSVTYLSDASSIEAGKKIFTTICSACHRADAGGVVGPNLTDEYWLHGGSINDIFKTIKYGVPEKGMKSWKDDYSPMQIAQLASFIKSVQGTNPPNPKEPQGEVLKN